MDNCFIFDSIPPRWWAFAYGPLFTYAYSSVFSHAISIRKSLRRTKTVCLCLCLCCARRHCRVFVLMLALCASTLPCVCAYVCTCVVGALNTVVLMFGAYVVVKTKLKMP